MDEGNYDIVLGSRFLRQKKGRFHAGNRIQDDFCRDPADKPVKSDGSYLRSQNYNRRVLASFAYRLNYGPEPDTISYLIKNGAHIAEAPVSIHERQAGESYLRL
jgi:hypothetical protein